METLENDRRPIAARGAGAGAERVSRQDKPEPVNAEVPFPLDDTFFSRTNEKGHILFGNSVFQRISHYSWAELSLRPHNIIRHPDMPRAVFWLLWETIGRGEPVGAYVKNMAKDGRYYWVFAIVTPIEGGYLSVRIKPTSALLPVVEREYAALLTVEKARRLKPAESAKILLARLSELGFRGYAPFMAAALSQEIKSRDEKLGRPLDRTPALFEAVAKEAAALLEHADEVVANDMNHRLAPLNMRVLAAQLGEAGATIGVIASNYSALSAAQKTCIADFIASAEKLFSAVSKGLFLVDTAKIQKEASEQFQAEAANGAPSPLEEIALLEAQRRSYEAQAAIGLRSIVAEAQKFEQSCAELKRAGAALETARIMGKVETARLGSANNGFQELLGELEHYQQCMAQGLQKMLATSSQHRAQRQPRFVTRKRAVVR